MRLKTQIADVNRHLAIRSAQQAVARAESDMLATALALVREAVVPESSEWWLPAVEANRQLQLVGKRIPAARATAARALVETMEAMAKSILLDLGSEYSGLTRRLVLWGPAPVAYTVKSPGVAYGGRKKSYCKTDADHCIQLEVEGAIYARYRPEVLTASRAVGLPIIWLHPDGRAVWATRPKGSIKTLAHGKGWVAYADGVCGHSQISMADAQANLQGHLDRKREDGRQLTAGLKERRRLRLVLRLCKEARATIADAKAMGFCTPGICAFQARYGVGDSAPLEVLVQSGNRDAIALAMHLAKKLKRERAAATG